jgi:hypothetical protein
VFVAASLVLFFPWEDYVYDTFTGEIMESLEDKKGKKKEDEGKERKARQDEKCSGRRENKIARPQSYNYFGGIIIIIS